MEHSTGGICAVPPDNGRVASGNCFLVLKDFTAKLLCASFSQAIVGHKFSLFLHEPYFDEHLTLSSRIFLLLWPLLMSRYVKPLKRTH